MKLSDSDFFDSLVSSALRPTPKCALDEWAEANVRLPFSAVSAKFTCRPTPYLREPLKCCSGDAMHNGTRVHRVTVVGSVQSAKSTLQEAVAAYAISEDPGPLMWNFQTDADASETFKERLERMFKATAKIARMLPRRYKTNHIDFPHMFAVIQGAETRSNLQSKPIRWLLNDETWLWPRGHLAEAEKRVTAFWNKFILNVSTGGVDDDDTDLAFRDGDCCEWMFRCRECNTLQPFQIKGRNKKFSGGVTWEDSPETRNADGTWNFAKVVRTIYFECSNQKCGCRMPDSVASRRAMNARAEYVPQNDNPLPGNRSFHFNALCVEWVTWATVVLEFLKAMEALKFGVTTPLQEFVQKRLGEFWKVQTSQASDETHLTGGYAMGDSWDDEDARFMSVDVQVDHFWYVVRAFSKSGDSRKIACGRISGSWDDVYAMQTRYKVRDRCVLVDASYGPGGQGPRAVFYQCCRFGWTAMMGDDAKGFTHIDSLTRRQYQRPVSRQLQGDPMRGARAGDKSEYDKSRMRVRTCSLFKWSNPVVKQVVDNLWNGRGKSWTVPMDTPQAWFKQLRAEMPQVAHDKITGKPKLIYVLVDRKNGAHLRDCECMITAAAMMGGYVADIDSAMGTGAREEPAAASD